MAKSFPPDVLVLDLDTLVHARMGRGRKGPRIMQAKSYRLAEGTFVPAVVTPELVNEAALAEALRRLRVETGRWDKVSLLLPDAWFRINIVELPSLPEKPADAMDVVRWSLKRTLPIPPEQLRVVYQVLSRTGGGAKVMVLSAVEKTLLALERIFAAAGLDIILLEPVGLNIWNAVAVREPDAPGNRLFVYVRESDFTTAVFNGSQPLFIRSRNLSRDRTLQQELRLSASYLRDSLGTDSFTSCHVAGLGADGIVHETLANEFNTKVQAIALRDYVDEMPAGITGYDAQLTACTGVFTG
ncbi:MAG: type pilus assembly protein PilM [Acidobacteriota bacterium]|jgi:type IV pilus assembly protein PilM|nr:type pilus assembly protein PilM [Acidobacteriota bacterium]